MVMMWLVIPLCMGLSKANIVKKDLIFFERECILWRFLTVKNMMHFVTIFNRQNMMHFVAIFNRQNMMKYK